MEDAGRAEFATLNGRVAALETRRRELEAALDLRAGQSRDAAQLIHAFRGSLRFRLGDRLANSIERMLGHAKSETTLDHAERLLREGLEERGT
jgi:hypothetical protein